MEDKQLSAKENIVKGNVFHNVFFDTVKALDGLVESAYYTDILESLKQGDASVELRKRVMLRAIDEKWINAVEDVLPSLELVTKNPRKFIEDKEYVLPISQSKSITDRSIRHLAQHVDYINDIRGDEIMPSKILNVFHEETMMTYENKFVNTLIHRLHTFVTMRYNSAKEHPQDTKSTSLTFDEKFRHGNIKGKLKFVLELEEPAISGDVEKNHTYSGDLWRRVQKIYSICQSYMNSEFVKSMGRASVRPPIIHTNAITKNKNLRDCLALWEFLDTYENIGYTMVVDERLEQLDEEYIRNLYSTMAVEYMLFREKVNADFDDDAFLAQTKTEVPFSPQVVEDIVPTDVEEFSAHYGLRLPNPNLGRELTELDHRILAAIDNALDAAVYQQQLKRLREVRKLHRSYMSKLIQGSDLLQGYYALIKNTLLSYKGVGSSVKWMGETFYLNAEKYAFMTVRGKSLLLYLAVNPNDYPVKVYHQKDVSDKLKYRKTPMLIRISSMKIAEQVCTLISDMFKGKTNYNKDYTYADFGMPYETDSQLIAEGLIRADDGYEGETYHEIDHEIVFTDAKKNVDSSVRYTRSFKAKLSQSDETVKQYYTQIAEALLALKGVKSRISSAKETFNKGRIKLAALTFKGKTLAISLPFNPEEYDVKKYHQIDIRKDGKEVALPMLIKVRSKRAAKQVLSLIEELVNNYELIPAKTPSILEPIPYQDDAVLLEQGLIKAVTIKKQDYRSPYKRMYHYSFVAAMIMADEQIASWYSAIKNTLLSFGDVHSKMGEYYETFTKGRNILARLAIKDGILTMFVALKPGSFSRFVCPYHTFDRVEDLNDTPLAVSITSGRVVAQVCRVVEKNLAEAFNLEKNNSYRTLDFDFETKTEQQLINEGFITPIDGYVEEEPPKSDENDFVALKQEIIPENKAEIEAETQVESEEISENQVEESDIEAIDNSNELPIENMSEIEKEDSYEKPTDTDSEESNQQKEISGESSNDVEETKEDVDSGYDTSIVTPKSEEELAKISPFVADNEDVENTEKLPENSNEKTSMFTRIIKHIRK